MQTRFRCGSTALPPLNLRAPVQHRGEAAEMNSPDHSTKGTPSPWRARPKAAHPCRLRLLVGAGVQGLFHSPLGVLFTFPSRYSFTIGGSEVFSLGGWSPLLPTGLHVSRGTQGHSDRTRHRPRLRGSHPLRHGFPAVSPDPAARQLSLVCSHTLRPTTPACTPLVRRRRRFGLLPVRSPLLRESHCVCVDFLSSGY